MTIQEYLNLYNLSFEEISENHHEIFNEIFENEKNKNWLVPIENKLDKFNDVQVESDIKFIIDKLKSEEIFTIDDSEKLTIFVSKINKIVRVANRINNFKEDTLLDNGSELKLFDLFNFIKSISKLEEFNYPLNKNLSSFKPHIFSLIKHCQNSLVYPIYYPFWQNISKYVLNLNLDYDSFTKFYNSFPEADRTLVFGSYFGTIAKLLINNIKGNTAINQTEVIAYLKKEIININEYTALLDNLNLTENKMKKYWIYSPGEQASKWEEFYDENIMALGWDELGDLNNYKDKAEIQQKLITVYESDTNRNNDANANYDFANTINVGDIIIVKKGRQQLLGYGQVESEYYFDEDRDDFKHCRKVEWKTKGNWQTDHTLVMKTLTDITTYNTEMVKGKKYYQHLLDIIDGKYSQEEILKNAYIDLLLYKKQIILQGPPGTGKTREAELIATEMLGLSDIKELINNEQYKLVQFHPSYTYEDFVRGIVAKPTKNGNGIFYEAENKTLGQFAQDALKNYNASKNHSADSNIDNWIDEKFEVFKYEIEAKLPDEETKLSGDISIFEVSNNYFKYAKNWNSSGYIKFGEFKKLIKAVVKGELELSNKQLNKERFIHAHYRYTYYNSLLKMFFEQFNYKNETYSVEEKKYLLIIDEINRANLSSVLGELIYALEYREKAVESMYSVDDSVLDSKNQIILPPNLYIIGTMNTADRSVGHIDYAIRRRFAFVEILPTALNDNKEIYFNTIGYNLIANLFNSENVSPEFELQDVQIGHSYFIAKKSEAKNERERDEIFTMKMRYEVLPILEEYVKDGILVGKVGALSIRDFIKSLKK